MTVSRMMPVTKWWAAVFEVILMRWWFISVGLLIWIISWWYIKSYILYYNNTAWTIRWKEEEEEEEEGFIHWLSAAVSKQAITSWRWRHFCLREHTLMSGSNWITKKWCPVHRNSIKPRVDDNLQAIRLVEIFWWRRAMHRKWSSIRRIIN